MFSTKIQISPADFKIAHKDKIMTLGSCFSENIGKKLQERCFDVDINPFGVLYNPFSVRNSLLKLIQNQTFAADDLFHHNSLWNSFSHSSLFSDIDVEKTLAQINGRMEKSFRFFQDTDFILITFGTAWVYESVRTGEIVANCHKLPSKEFLRYRLSIDDIVDAYKEIIAQIQRLNPDIKIIFTLSPIRHWKDGAHENNISKSILLLAINELEKLFDAVYYFPAYEIMLDELRDYRFYAEDMLHPSAVAVDYIWQQFVDCYFSEDTKNTMSEIMSLINGLRHKALHPETENYQLFLKDLDKKKQELFQKYPFLKERIKKL